MGPVTSQITIINKATINPPVLPVIFETLDDKISKPDGTLFLFVLGLGFLPELILFFSAIMIKYLKRKRRVKTLRFPFQKR